MTFSLGAETALAKNWTITYKGQGVPDDSIDLVFDAFVNRDADGDVKGQLQDIEADNVPFDCTSGPKRIDNVTFEAIEPIKVQTDGDFRGSTAEFFPQTFSGTFLKAAEDDLDEKVGDLPRARGVFKYLASFGINGQTETCKTGRIEWKARAVRREVGGFPAERTTARSPW